MWLQRLGLVVVLTLLDPAGGSACTQLEESSLIFESGYIPARVEKRALPENDFIHYSHGVTATVGSMNIDQLKGLLGAGKSVDADTLEKFKQDARQVYVTRGTQPRESFSRESRGLEFYRTTFFPAAILDAKRLAGRRVFDAGCGTAAKAVQEMRKEGISAFGSDIYLDEDVREIPYLAMLDLFSTQLVSGQFYLVLAGFGALSYLDTVPIPVQRTVLGELFRLLEPGGSLLVSPFDLDALKALVKDLKLKANVDVVQDGPVMAARITKKKAWWKW